jgi:hypothetical protein
MGIVTSLDSLLFEIVQRVAFMVVEGEKQGEGGKSTPTKGNQLPLTKNFFRATNKKYVS